MLIENELVVQDMLNAYIFELDDIIGKSLIAIYIDGFGLACYTKGYCSNEIEQYLETPPTEPIAPNKYIYSADILFEDEEVMGTVVVSTILPLKDRDKEAIQKLNNLVANQLDLSWRVSNRIKEYI